MFFFWSSAPQGENVVKDWILSIFLFFFKLNSLSLGLQVHCRVDSFKLQPETRGPSSARPAVGHLAAGPGCGLARHLRHQQRAGPRPQRVQTGGQQLCGLLVGLLLLHPLSHHGPALLWGFPRAAALGGRPEGQTAQQHRGLQEAAARRRCHRPAPAGGHHPRASAHASTQDHREGLGPVSAGRHGGLHAAGDPVSSAVQRELGAHDHVQPTAAQEEESQDQQQGEEGYEGAAGRRR